MKIAAYVNEPAEIRAKIVDEEKMFSAGEQFQPSLKAQTTLKFRLLLSPLFVLKRNIERKLKNLYKLVEDEGIKIDSSLG